MSSSLIDAVRPHLPTDLDTPDCLDADVQRDLLYALAEVPDPRQRRGVRYRLASLLAVAVCAVLAGASTFAAIADWAADLDPPARRRLGLLGRIPAGSTVWRFLVRVDATVLQAVLTGWLRRRMPTRPAEPGRRARAVIAVDGKLLRGARLPAGRQVHLLAAYEVATGIVLAQVAVEAKSNENPAFAPLLDQGQARLGSLAGTIIVADALHAQVGHAHTVAAHGGYLMVTVKANRPTLLEQLRTLPWAQVPVGHRTRSRAHGRRETRTVKAVTVATPDGLQFPHAAQAVRITRTRTLGGKTTRQTAYLVVSLPAADAQPADLADWSRRAWHIENRLHWVRDVTFGEDAHQARTGNGPAVAAVLRNTAIGFHRSNGEPNIARATRRASRRPHDLIDAVTSRTRTQ
ncbi:ISAs1 family transposase [Natronosporangium hydrolyticum]|uniref:ISAs1 family transposase n=1 Tax=Natronosporangium hydrolyticum TaxID=2811111 RepID=UPI001EFA0B77|nr:ISAs1 family transposase [Natronosporangium hydrolyticum]